MSDAATISPTTTTGPQTVPDHPAAAPAAPQAPPPVASVAGTAVVAAEGYWTTPRCAWLVGGSLTTIWLIAFAVFMGTWPALRALSTTPDEVTRLALLTEPRFLGLLAASGALGASLHAMASFTGYLGNGQFSRSWTLWYLTRAPIGATMALIFMPMIGAGLIPEGTNEKGSGTFVFTVISLGILVGMFSKDATDKLTDIFSAILTSKRDIERAGKMTIPTPRITAVQPASVTVGATDRELTLTGADFLPTCAVLINGAPRRCQTNSATSMTVWLEPEDVASAGTLSVVPRNPDGGRPVDGAAVTVGVVGQ